MSTYSFHPFDFSDESYEAITHIWNTVWPDEATTMAAQKHRDSIRERYFWQRVLCEENGRIIGYGLYCETWWSQKPGKYYFDFATLPEHRNRGIASTVLEMATDALHQQDTFNLLTADTREDQTQSIDFLTKRGFKQVMRFPTSRLDVQAFQPEQYAALTTKLAGEGVRLLPLSELQHLYSDWQERAWAMECEIEKDIPSPDPITPEPLEQYIKGHFESPNFQPETFFIAVDGDAFVGLSVLRKSPDAATYHTGLTGVLRSHRRRGLATALKAKAIGTAKEHGITLIDTDNEEHNPMYQINMQLGFQPAPAFVDFHKEIV